MSDRVFLDTNVFVYLYDSDQPDKQARARALVERLGLSDAIVISTQVLQEFYVNVTRKFAKQLSDEQILLATRTLGRLRVVEVSVEMPKTRPRPKDPLVLAMDLEVPVGTSPTQGEKKVSYPFDLLTWSTLPTPV